MATMEQQTHVAEILDAAAALIERNGWVQGTFGMLGEPHCAVGAMIECTLGRVGLSLVTDQAVSQFVGEPTMIWNDRPERTQNEVTSTMRAVAMTLRAAASESVPRNQRVAEVSAGISELMEQTE